MIDQVLRAVLPQLDRLGIPYLITGGIAATLHGRPRFTQDIDFVIAPSRSQLEGLAGRIPATRPNGERIAPLSLNAACNPAPGAATRP
jgi:hypothetical protein